MRKPMLRLSRKVKRTADAGGTLLELMEAIKKALDKNKPPAK